MHDTHFHFSDKLREYFPIKGIANAASPGEYELLDSLKNEGGFLVSAGIHPWYADRYDFSDFRKYLEKADFVGEIGLDSVWCETPADIQLDRFIRQLQFASDIHKPVILHTKGMEKEIADIIKDYPNTYLVHWYSAEEYLDDYISLGCYFSVGPSVGMDEAVNNVVRKAPADRLLLETDGLNAVAWAFDCDESEVDYRKTFERSVQQISLLREEVPRFDDNASYGSVGSGRQSSFALWEKKLDENFAAFCKNAASVKG